MKKLSDSEFEIMKALWRKNEALTSNQILDEVRGKLDWKLASLMTALARMVEKGYVSCDRSTRTNYYTAVVSEEQYKMEESDSFLEKLYDKSAAKLVASLYHGSRLSGKEVKELREFLDSLEKENGEERAHKNEKET